LEPAAGEIELFDDERVEQAGQISAGRHANAGKGFLDSAGTADARAAFDDEYAFAGPSEISTAGQSIVSGADNDRVPGFRGKFANGHGEADFTENFGCG